MRKNTFLFIALGLFLAVYTASAQQTFTVKGQLDVSLSGYEIECFFVDVYDNKFNYITPVDLKDYKDYSFQFELAPGDYYLSFWIGLHANNISVFLTYYLDGETKRLKSPSEVQSTDLTPLSVSGNIDLGTLRRDASNDVVNISVSIKMPFDINLEGPGDRYQLEIEMSKYNTFSLFSSSSSFYLEEVAKGEILKFSGLIEKGVYDTGTFLISKGCGEGTTYNGIVYRLYLKHTEDGWQTSTQRIESKIDLTHDVSNIDLMNPPGVHTVSGKLINASGIVPCIVSCCASSDYINNDTKTFNFTLAEGGTYTFSFVRIDKCYPGFHFTLDRDIDFGTIDCSNIASIAGYPILDLHILDFIEPTNTENVYHFTEKIFDPYGTAHIYVNTIKTGTEAVDIYAKCTYPNGRSYWLYFDTEIDTCEEWGCCFYWQEKGTWLKFHNTPEPEWTNLIFDELTDYALIHPALWFDKRKEAEWNLPNGVYTWEIYILPHGTSVTTEEDVKNNAVQIDSAVLTLIAIPGDCNGDGTTTIDEVQKCINCFLGIENDCCDRCDLNNDDQVTIDEVQKIINAFLGIV